MQNRARSLFITFITIAGIFGLNLALVWPLFTGEYTQYMGSVEPVYMAAARFIVEHSPYPSWNPLWYGGYPFRIFYTPILPYALAVLHVLTSLSIPSLYRLVTALLYILTPVTWYLLVKYLTKNHWAAVFAAVAYSLLPSFAYIIPGVRSAASSYGYAPWQLLVLMLYGEGPHTCALAFTPLAVLFFLRALREPKLVNYLFAAIFISLVALINFIALYALVMILIVVLISEMMLREPAEKLKRTAVLALLTYGMCAFWFNLSFIKASFAFGTGSQVLGNLTSRWPLWAVLAILVGTLIAVLSGKERFQPLSIGLFWLGGTGLIVFSWYVFHLAMAPQPNRYMAEMNMAFTLLLGLGLSSVIELLRRRAILRGLLAFVVLAVFGALSLPFWRVSHAIMGPKPGIEGTFEYEVARWLADHVQGQERAYVTGNATFWMNLFTDVPQVRGGLDQSATNPWWNHAAYQINTGSDGSVAILWAKAFNVRYILVNYPESQDPFHDYLYPHKFEGLLEPAYSSKGNVIYQVPLATADLVRVVGWEKLQAIPPIENALDKEGLQAYIDLVEGGTEVPYSVDSADKVSIDADLETGEVILVRTTYDTGWRAYASGKRLAVRPDPLGFMVIEPASAGEYQIVLQHGRVWDEWLGYGITGLTLLGLMAYSVTKSILRH